VIVVSGIIANGFAYEDFGDDKDGNVWFDTQAFGAAKE
jgi:hypothetical protein